jgi:hypothetical protein
MRRTLWLSHADRARRPRPACGSVASAGSRVRKRNSDGRGLTSQPLFSALLAAQVTSFQEDKALIAIVSSE